MQPREILFIIEIIFWTPTLGLALYVCFRQGFSKQLGWLSLVLLGTFRMVGAATGIVAVTDPSQGVIETSVISESVGLISLVGALTGLTFRIQQNLPPNHSLLGPFPARVVHLATVAALILSILAGSDFASTNSASDIAQGHTFIKAAVGLLSAVYVFVGGLAVFTRVNQQQHVTAPGESRLLNVTCIILPLIAVRLIYAWLGACLSETSVFSLFSNSTGAIVVRAFMQIAAELLAAWTIIWAGCTVPKSEKRPHAKHELGSGYGGSRGGKSAMLERGLHNVWHAGDASAARGKPETTVNEV